MTYPIVFDTGILELGGIQDLGIIIDSEGDVYFFTGLVGVL